MHIFANSGVEKHGLPERNTVVGNVVLDKRKGGVSQSKQPASLLRYAVEWLLDVLRKSSLGELLGYSQYTDAP